MFNNKNHGTTMSEIEKEENNFRCMLLLLYEFSYSKKSRKKLTLSEINLPFFQSFFWVCLKKMMEFIKMMKKITVVVNEFLGFF